MVLRVQGSFRKSITEVNSPLFRANPSTFGVKTISQPDPGRASTVTPKSLPPRRVTPSLAYAQICSLTWSRGWGSEFGVWGLGFGFWVLGLGLGGLSLCFRGSGSGCGVGV